MLPIPPTTTMVMNMMEMASTKDSGFTYFWKWANSAPPSPAKAALSTKTCTL